MHKRIRFLVKWPFKRVTEEKTVSTQLTRVKNMKTTHSKEHYLVEFNGYDYAVLLGFTAVAVFATIDEAFAAKRTFEERPIIHQLDKTPPAMRVAKQRHYG